MDLSDTAYCRSWKNGMYYDKAAKYEPPAYTHKRKVFSYKRAVQTYKDRP